eukprot:4841825-Lingulodinium_polyedra.AAC.1
MRRGQRQTPIASPVGFFQNAPYGHWPKTVQHTTLRPRMHNAKYSPQERGCWVLKHPGGANAFALAND